VCAPLLQVVIAGPRGDAATEALIQAAHSVFAPDKVLRIQTRAPVLQLQMASSVHASSSSLSIPSLTLDMCWRLLQVVISIDPTQRQEMDYWKQHNQEAYSMVEGAAEKLQDRCAVAAGPCIAMAYTFLPVMAATLCT
jgi:hypothetical protein